MNKAVLSKEELEYLYLEKKMSMNKISKLKNISIGKVFNLLHQFDIPTRSQKDTFTMKGHRLTDSQKERIRKLHLGKKASVETKEKMSKSKFKGGVGHKKNRKDGYVAIYIPEHPRASKDGYVLEHVLMMEMKIGRHLQENEVVHHINKIRDDNRLENLKLMTKYEHMSFHMKERRGLL